MVDKQPSHNNAGQRVQETALERPSDLDRADRLRRFLVERHHSLTPSLPRGDVQPGRPVRVCVEAVMRQSANLVPPCPAPACDQERCSLVRTLQRPDGAHQPGELGLGDVARYPLGDLGKITWCYNRIRRHVLPTPGGDVAEEYCQSCKPASFAQRRVELPRPWVAHRVQGLRVRQHMITRHLGQRV